MSKKKILSVSLSVAMLALIIVGASLAYFTDRTQTENNVFTLGNVDISLTEPSWDKNATHKLMPGTFLDKDPTVKVEANSEDCWVFVELEFSRYVPMMQYLTNTVDGFANMTAIQKSVALTNAFLKDFDNTKWKIMNEDAIPTAPDADGSWPGTVKLILGYQAAPQTAGTEIVVFTKAGLPADLTQENASLFFKYADGTPKEGANEIHLNVTAAAIQAEGLADIDAAYTALYTESGN